MDDLVVGGEVELASETEKGGSFDANASLAFAVGFMACLDFIF